MSEGRIFFSNTGRTLTLEDEIRLVSVGVDIGSSTSHLVFSRIVLERLDARYVVTGREAFHQSDILLTPYAEGETIDADALGEFLDRQYRAARISPDDIDTGALILTGVAVRRRNARAIGELFARQAGKLVAVSAGDGLETVMAAYGSGAVARSIRAGSRVLNVDVGGGTAKLALVEAGRIVAQTALDVGARLVALDSAGRIARIEEAGRRFAAELGMALAPGDRLDDDAARALAAAMADALFSAMGGGTPRAGGTSLLRLDPLGAAGAIDEISFSGGVAEYIYGREMERYGDLGLHLAAAIRARLPVSGARLVQPAEGIRATVIGAAQYTIQVSGSTIYVAPLSTLPLRSLAVAAPDLALDAEDARCGAHRRGGARGAAAARPRVGRERGGALRAVARLGDFRAARRVLPRRHRGAGAGAGAGPSAGAGGRRRCRRPHRHPLPRGAGPRQRRSSRSTGSSSRNSTISTSAR